MEFVAKLLLLLPLLSGSINGFFYKSIGDKKASIYASSALVLSAIFATILFIHVGIYKGLIHVILFSWIDIVSLKSNWSIYVDELTALMFIIVTYVSAVVHIYSVGYMCEDKNLPKFLSYLSFFTFFMLALVSADNFLQLFFGWEGVGVCSYLLIGYYYQKESANKAAIKAFIVNRVGDFALILCIAIIFIQVGSLEYLTIFAQSETLASQNYEIFGMEFGLLDVICMLLFIGCMGKSAQIGLHVWLPDAMEGPTPVSALIHAATMVTAGVFLVARCSYLFEYSPNILQIITIIGAVTCLFAASIAIAQEDIKKIIAYSTCSQLGYMFFACGVSAYHAGVFHLITHGFFKALLFLSAGSVIHACHEQNIFKMGGLRIKMPVTYAYFWLGSLAIVGVFPFAGFYSKDLVLESAYAAGGVGELAYILGIIAAILTAIYSMKILLLAFHGRTRLSAKSFEHAHESPLVMNAPLILLVAGTLFSGMFGYYILQIGNPFGYFGKSIFIVSKHNDHNISMIIETLPLIIGISGLLIGAFLYTGGRYQSLTKQFGMILSLLKNKYYFDEIYHQIFVKMVKNLSNMSKEFDVKVIDRFGPGGVSITTRCFSWAVSQLQTGYIYSYILYIMLALVICLTLHLSEIFVIWR